MTAALVFLTALLVALAADRYFGEPPVRYHPVVWMGNYLDWAGNRVQRLAGQGLAFSHRGHVGSQADFKAFWLAALVWIGGAAVVLIATLALQWCVLVVPGLLMQGIERATGPIFGGFIGSLLSAVLLGCLLKPMLAWAMLRSEVLAVEVALNPAHGGSLTAGRGRLSWLVSRDVTHMSEAQVRESAIESLAENLNDSVIAPIFWFVLLGLPGAAVYRFANTADAMWGYPGVYKGHNWQWAGKWAARADDVLSWVPARITGVLLAAVSHGVAWRTLRTEAARTPSPNSGWPMAAMALALGVSLRKPDLYTLNPAGRHPGPDDMAEAQRLAGMTVRSVAGLACLTLACLSIWMVFK